MGNEAPIRIEDGWVACDGAMHPMTGRLVDCPLGLVRFGRCLSCHLLEYSSRERSNAEWCEAGPDGEPADLAGAGLA
jgi:hypothetical protein